MVDRAAGRQNTSFQIDGSDTSGRVCCPVVDGAFTLVVLQVCVPHTVGEFDYGPQCASTCGLVTATVNRSLIDAVL